ncbi:hypothetical protein [Micromonospora sp. NPDC093277]|uniref:hypothetical protein n=1 Tax=Micromonospora sp. NPDC093277 TaxID=3364291 RepID=UPI0037F20BBC
MIGQLRPRPEVLLLNDTDADQAEVALVVADSIHEPALRILRALYSRGNSTTPDRASLHAPGRAASLTTLGYGLDEPRSNRIAARPDAGTRDPATFRDERFAADPDGVDRSRSSLGHDLDLHSMPEVVVV